MKIKNDLLRLADIMRTTYIQKDIKLRLSLFKGEHDPEPKSKSVGFSVKMNLAEAAAIGAGVALAVVAISECRQKICENRALKRLLEEKEEKELNF
ncbi:MAG: hypothetical protein E7588_05775 [Ruminococcaceae bacterium]|nr:hypothetical protein [Oscillospiraceae bacterium]